TTPLRMPWRRRAVSTRPKHLNIPLPLAGAPAVPTTPPAATNTIRSLRTPPNGPSGPGAGRAPARGQAARHVAPAQGGPASPTAPQDRVFFPAPTARGKPYPVRARQSGSGPNPGVRLAGGFGPGAAPARLCRSTGGTESGEYVPRPPRSR